MENKVLNNEEFNELQKINNEIFQDIIEQSNVYSYLIMIDDTNNNNKKKIQNVNKELSQVLQKHKESSENIEGLRQLIDNCIVSIKETQEQINSNNKSSTELIVTSAKESYSLLDKKIEEKHNIKMKNLNNINDKNKEIIINTENIIEKIDKFQIDNTNYSKMNNQGIKNIERVFVERSAKLNEEFKQNQKTLENHIDNVNQYNSSLSQYQESNGIELKKIKDEIQNVDDNNNKVRKKGNIITNSLLGMNLIFVIVIFILQFIT